MREGGGDLKALHRVLFKSESEGFGTLLAAMYSLILSHLTSKSFLEHRHAVSLLLAWEGKFKVHLLLGQQ